MRELGAEHSVFLHDYWSLMGLFNQSYSVKGKLIVNLIVHTAENPTRASCKAEGGD